MMWWAMIYSFKIIVRGLTQDTESSRSFRSNPNRNETNSSTLRILFPFNYQLRPLNEEKEVIITENRTLAEDNVNKEPEIIERKSRVSELSEQGKTLCENVQEKLSDLSKFTHTSELCRFPCKTNNNNNTAQNIKNRILNLPQKQRKATKHPKRRWLCYKQPHPKVKPNPRISLQSYRSEKLRSTNFWSNSWRPAKRCICANWNQKKWLNWYDNNRPTIGMDHRPAHLHGPDQCIHHQIFIHHIHQLVVVCHIQLVVHMECQCRIKCFGTSEWLCFSWSFFWGRIGR